MQSRELKVKVLEALKEGKITKAEAKVILEKGVVIKPIAWAGEEEEHNRHLDLIEKVTGRIYPRFTWAKTKS